MLKKAVAAKKLSSMPHLCGIIKVAWIKTDMSIANSCLTPVDTVESMQLSKKTSANI